MNKKEEKHYNKDIGDIFYYINDSELRLHMVDAFSCIIHLIAATDTFPNDIQYMIRKTCIIYMASIIEAHLLYIISYMGYTSHKSTKKWEYTVKSNFSIDTHQYHVCTRKRKEFSIKNADFNLLNQICKEKGILGEKEFKDVDYIRKIRNKIHLSNVENIDKNIRKTEVDKVFASAYSIFQLVRKKCENV